MMPEHAVLLDVNVLFALSWDQHVHHAAAHRNFADLDAWSTTPVTEAGLVRLLLTPAVVGRQITGSQALAQLASIRQTPGWSFLADAATLADPLIDTSVLMGRRQVTDLHLVNLAASHRMQLVTFDAGMKSALVAADQGWVQVWSA